MGKFKINDVVLLKENGTVGTVVHRDEVCDKKKNRTTVKYLVKFGNGEENYKWFSRKDLKRNLPNEDNNEPRTITKVYDAQNGYKVTLVAIVENAFNFCYPFSKVKELRIGASFYNPEDKYDEKIGFKIAKHRAYHRPFTHMIAKFLGEFNTETTEAIMDVKAKYLCNNLNNFIDI